MSIRNLDALFSPASIALIGASNRPNTVGGVLARNMLAAGFAGPVMPVNPRERAIAGILSYKDVASLPLTPDLAVIATPPDTVPALVAELGRRGTRAAIVIAAGFGEGETIADRTRLRSTLEAARPSLMRVIGPNSLGILVPGLGLNASFAHRPALKGDIAFVTQSGAMITSVLDWAAARHIGFSHIVSLGDMGDVDFGDMLDWLALDSATNAILLYVESIGQARKFMSAARVAARAKPVIVVKAGRSVEAQRAATSHTGAVAGADAVYDAAFRRAGMLRVADLDELFEAVTTLSTARPIHGDRLAILGNGGGLGVLATDALIQAGGRLAPLGEETLRRLDAILPRGWSHGNPIDLRGDASAERYRASIATLKDERNIDALLVIHSPAAMTTAADAAEATLRAAGEVPWPVLTSWVGAESVEVARQLFAAARLPTYETPRQAVRGFMHLVSFRRNREMLMETPPSVPDDFAIDAPAARAAMAAALAEGRETLSGTETAALLAACSLAASSLAASSLAAAAPAAVPGQAGTVSLGLFPDELFGPVLRVGPADATPDSPDCALGLPPLNLHLAREMIGRSRLGRTLAARPATIDAVALALIKLSQAAIELPEIVALEIEAAAGEDGESSVRQARARVARPADPGRPRLAIRPYPRSLEKTLVLREGRRILLRPIVPEDEPALERMFDKMDREDIRLRFFAPMGRLSHNLAARLTQLDYDRQMALVALAPEETAAPEILGVVRLSADPDNEKAEYAILVRSDIKGAGLGYTLMQEMIAYARARGLGEVHGLVLRENERMLAMCRELGFTLSGEPEDPTVVRVTLPLR